MQDEPLLYNPLLQIQLYPSKVVTQVEFGGHNDVLIQLLAVEMCKSNYKLLKISSFLNLDYFNNKLDFSFRWYLFKEILFLVLR